MSINHTPASYVELIDMQVRLLVNGDSAEMIRYYAPLFQDNEATDMQVRDAFEQQVVLCRDQLDLFLASRRLRSARWHHERKNAEAEFKQRLRDMGMAR